jgi:hypothetical protein
VREAHERRAVPAVQVVDRLASVRCCVRGVGCVGCCLRVWRLPGLPAEASTGETTQSGRQADRQTDRRAVTSNFSGTGIESCGTAAWAMGPWAVHGRPWPLDVATRSASPGRPHFQTVARRLGCHVEALWRCLAQSAMPPLPTAGPAGLLACSLTLTLALVLCELLTAAVAPLSPGRRPSAVGRRLLESCVVDAARRHGGRVAASRARVPAPSRGPGSTVKPARQRERAGRRRRPGEGRGASIECRTTPSARARPSCHTRRPRPASQWRRLQPWAAAPSRNLARLQASYRPFSSARLFALVGSESGSRRPCPMSHAPCPPCSQPMPIAHGAHHILHRAIALSGAGLITCPALCPPPSPLSPVSAHDSTRLIRTYVCRYPAIRHAAGPVAYRSSGSSGVGLVRPARLAEPTCWLRARRHMSSSLACRRLWATTARPVRRLRPPGSHSGGVLRIAALGSCPFLTQIFAPNRRSGCPCPHSRRRALQLVLDTLTALAFAPFTPTPSTPAPKTRVCLDGRSARARPAASMLDARRSPLAACRLTPDACRLTLDMLAWRPRCEPLPQPCSS